jgi:hypothetical protein
LQIIQRLSRGGSCALSTSWHNIFHYVCFMNAHNPSALATGACAERRNLISVILVLVISK